MNVPSRCPAQLALDQASEACSPVEHNQAVSCSVAVVSLTPSLGLAYLQFADDVLVVVLANSRPVAIHATRPVRADTATVGTTTPIVPYGAR